MPFKIAFILTFVTAASIAAAAARRATRRHGGSLNQLAHEVPGVLAIRAALGLIFYAALATWLFDLRIGAWSYLPIPATARWIGVACLLPTVVFFGWSFSNLGTNYRGGIGLYPAHELVTRGPYRLIRHPIYVAFVALMVLVLVVSANWLLGVSGILLVVSIAAARIPVEERQLADRFGSEWVEYRSKTGQVLPRRKASR